MSENVTVADLVAYLQDNVDLRLPLTDDPEGWAKVPAQVAAWKADHPSVPVSTNVPVDPAALLVQRIRTLAETLTNKIRAQYPNTDTTYALDESFNGRRFHRIVSLDQGNARSVHAFVDKVTGAIYKAGTWKAPQRSREGVLAVRGNLLSDADFARLIRVCDPYGDYLYVK